MGLIPPNWTKTPKGKIAREMWAILKPGGEMVISSDFESESDAWRIARGIPRFTMNLLCNILHYL